MALTVAEVAELCSGKLEGDGDATVTGVAPLKSAGPQDVSFLTQGRYAAQVTTTQAAVVLLAPDSDARREGPMIRVEDPQAEAIRVIHALGLQDTSHPFEGVSDKAHIDPGAELGDGVVVAPFATICKGARIGAHCVLYPGAYVGRGVTLGSDCILHPHAVVRHSEIGKRVVIGPGAVIGFDGFGYHPTAEGVIPVPQLGRVVLGDDVVVGANTTVDRARFDETRLGKNVALDNLVHVAHNCTIGEYTLIAAQTGLSGGAVLGARCLLAGQAGLMPNVEVGDDTRIAAKSGVARSFPGGGALSGHVAKEHGAALRELIELRRLPELAARIRKLEQQRS